MAQLIGFLGNEAVSFDFHKQEFTYLEDGRTMSNGFAVALEMRFTKKQTVVIGGQPYFKDEQAQVCTPVGFDDGVPVTFAEVKRGGQSPRVPVGEEFEVVMKKTLGDEVERLVRGKLLTAYLDNVPFVMCREVPAFFSSMKGGVWLNKRDVGELGLTIAYYPVVRLERGLYFHDAETKQLVRVRNPRERIKGEGYVRTCAGRGLIPVAVDAYKRELGKELGGLEMRPRQDMDRGGT